MVPASRPEPSDKERDTTCFNPPHPFLPSPSSQYDLRNAWPWYSYLILEVRDGRDGALRAWRLSDDRQRFEEEPLEEITEERA